MTTIEWLLAIIGSLIILPALAYLVAKMFAEGWFRGKSQAEKLENQQPKKGPTDGSADEEGKGKAG